MEITSSYKGLWFSYPTAAEIVTAGTVFTFLDCLAVGSRFYTRKMQKQRVMTDDWLTIPALILIVGMNTCLFYGVSQGVFGYPSPPNNIDLFTGDVSQQYVLNEKLSVPFTLMMIVAYGCIKLSVLFFYRRVFTPTWRTPFGITCIISMIVIICWTIAVFIGFGLSCGTHPSALWGNIYYTVEYCPNGFVVELALFVSDLITDVLVLVLPIPTIWSLQMSFGRKISVTAILLLGGMALAASITRVAIFVEIERRGFDLTQDINLSVSTTLYWSSIEAGLGLFAICLPSLRPLVTDRGPLVRTWNHLLQTISFDSLSWRSITASKNSRERANNRVLDEYRVLEDSKVSSETSEWSQTGIPSPELTHIIEMKALTDYEDDIDWQRRRDAFVMKASWSTECLFQSTIWYDRH